MHHSFIQPHFEGGGGVCEHMLLVPVQFHERASRTTNAPSEASVSMEPSPRDSMCTALCLSRIKNQTRATQIMGSILSIY